MDVNMTTRKRDCSRELHLSATVRVVPAVVAIDIAKVKLASKIMTFNCFMTTIKSIFSPNMGKRYSVLL